MIDAKDRIRAILTSEHAELFPTLSRMMAFETDESIEVCLGVLAAAKVSRDEYIAQHPELARQEADRLAKASWSHAVASANERFH